MSASSTARACTSSGLARASISLWNARPANSAGSLKRSTSASGARAESKEFTTASTGSRARCVTAGRGTWADVDAQGPRGQAPGAAETSVTHDVAGSRSCRHRGEAGVFGEAGAIGWQLAEPSGCAVIGWIPPWGRLPRMGVHIWVRRAGWRHQLRRYGDVQHRCMSRRAGRSRRRVGDTWRVRVGTCILDGSFVGNALAYRPTDQWSSTRAKHATWLNEAKECHY